MSKVKIKVVLLGHLPHSINLKNIENYKSALFEIMPEINSYNIVGDSDGEFWEFSDDNITQQLPKTCEADILLAITNVPLQHHYFVRRFNDNRLCLTYSSMTEILGFNNIPLENLILRLLYSASLIYKRYGEVMPLSTEQIGIIHDETRGCVFDMDGVKSDVVFSLNKPQLCHSCVEELVSNRDHKVQRDLIDKIQKELKGIKKGRFYQLSDFVKRRPIIALIISSGIAVILGCIGSVLGSYIWETFLR